MAPRNPRKLAALAYDGMGTFELGIVSEVFGLSRPELNIPWYEFRVFSLDRAPLRGTGGIRVQAPHGMGVLRSAGTIIVPGWHVDEAPPEALLRRLRAAHAAGARLVSICSGVFVLAATGLLDGSGLPRIGGMRNGWPRVIQAFRWKRTASMWMRAAFSLRRAVRRGSTCVCTSCASSMVPP